MAPSVSAIEFDGLGEGLSAATPYFEALTKCRAIEQTAFAVGDVSMAARAKRAAAECCRRVGRMSEAADHLKVALALFRFTNELQEQALTLWCRANLKRQEGSLKESLADLYRAWALLTRQGGPKLTRLSSYIAAGIAEVTRIQGLYILSTSQHRYAAELFQANRDVRGVIWALEGLGQIQKNCIQLGEAARLFEDAIYLASRSGDQRALGWGYRGLAEVYRLSKRPSPSRSYLLRARDLFTASDCDVGVGYTLRSLGDLDRDSGQIDVAFQHYRKANLKFQQTKESRGSSFVAESVGRMLTMLEKRDASVEVSRAALRWFHRRRISLGIQQTSEHLRLLSVDPTKEIRASTGPDVTDTVSACNDVLEDYT